VENDLKKGAPGEITRFPSHSNAFGFLRLFFASLVIISHTPEIMDGNRNREILTMLFGTVSLGELSVAGFFSISGYLIAGSFLKDSRIFPFFAKRVIRIYPGFMVSSIICIFLVAPLSGASLSSILEIRTLLRCFVRIASLQPPFINGAFAETHYPLLNGSMWTIAYEFRCYILIAILGSVGVLQKRYLILFILVILLSCLVFIDPNTMSIWTAESHGIKFILGDFETTLKLSAIFLTGSFFYSIRDRLNFSVKYIVLSVIALSFSLYINRISNAGLAVFGGYVIICTANIHTPTIFSKINNRNDISYGVYLYAWPIVKLLIWYFPEVSICLTDIVVLTGSYLCGTISWFCVEKPTMRILQSRSQLSRGQSR
jgi:peptidoglycan/LPS O-acetylase OafA/YrhL